ncbi:MAG: AhpC/TSA family protein [Bacteroidales bacterium]|nr:AhpC/TSA family protein [Bacteroidales bacterium]
MKKIILLLLPAVVLFSCKGTVSEGFKVSGIIKNATGKKLILNKFTSEATIKLDTVLLNEKGEFSFQNSTSSPELFSLQLQDEPSYILFIADSLDIIEINSDANTYRSKYSVSGSEHSVLLKEMYDHLDVTFEKIDSLNKLYIENKGNANIDSLQKSIGEQYTKLLEEHKTYAKDFIDKNIESPAVIMALYQSIGPRQQIFTLENDRDYFVKVSESLSALYPESDFVNGLVMLLENNPPVKGKPKVGTTAPEISQPTPEGKTITLTSLRGNYVLLDFWAAWCRPCRAENPTVLKNYNKYKSKGFTIYQVSLDQKKEDWVKAIEKDGLGDWTHVSDLQYWQSVPAAKYGVRSIPSNFLLDPEGVIIAVDLRGPSLGQKLTEIYGF